MDDAASSARTLDVRRNTRALTLAQICLWAILGIVVANGPLAAVRLSGRTLWAGVLIAVLTVAEAGGAAFTGRMMDRRGRRPGLALGHLLMATGGVVLIPTALRSLAGILLGTAAVGAGAGAALLARGAVAEMHPIEVRGRAVGRLLVAGTLGAVGAPPLIGAVQTSLDTLGGLDPLLLPWLLVPVLGVAGLGCVLSMRRDPRALAVDEAGLEGVRRPLRTVLAQPPVRAALITIAAAQTVMVAIMGVATIVIHDHGGGDLASSVLVSVHLAGMFAFTPLIGAFIDRFGRRPALAAGAAIASSGALVGAFAGGVSPFGVGFFLIGLGWSAAYVGATAVVSDLTSASERAGALGFTDLLTHSCSAGGGLIGGLVADTAGFSALGIAMAVLGVLALPSLVRVREPAPGRWEVEEPAEEAAPAP